MLKGTIRLKVKCLHKVGGKKCGEVNIIPAKTSDYDSVIYYFKAPCSKCGEQLDQDNCALIERDVKPRKPRVKEVLPPPLFDVNNEKVFRLRTIATT